MQRAFLALLVPTAAILAMPSCELAPEQASERLEFRTIDVCVIVNEPPDRSGDEAGDPPDLELFPPCTTTGGCVEPASGYFYHTYYNATGYFNVSGECPPWQPDPTVEAASVAEATSECFDLYGEFCRDLCSCHGGVAVESMAEVVACVDPVDETTYSCGCMCTLP